MFKYKVSPNFVTLQTDVSSSLEIISSSTKKLNSSTLYEVVVFAVDTLTIPAYISHLAKLKVD